MEEIQERVTHRPDFGQYQFGGISGPLSRSAQSGPAQRVAEAAGGASTGTVFRDVARGAGPVDEHRSGGSGALGVSALEDSRARRTQRGDLSEIGQFGGGSSWLAGRSGPFAP